MSIWARHAAPKSTHREIIAMRVEPRRIAVVSLASPMSNFGRKTIKNGHDPKVIPVVFIDVVLQSLCYLKMRVAHFTGEARQRTYEM